MTIGLRSLVRSHVNLGEALADDNVVPVVLANPPKKCPKCRHSGLYRHGRRDQKYVDVPHFAQPTHLLFLRQRWRCVSCEFVFSDQSDDLDDKHMATKRLIAYVGVEATIHTFAEVARKTGITDVTVKNMFMEHVKRLENKYKFETPEVLGIDEVKMVGEYRCVLTNIGHLTLYDILPSRRLDKLREYFGKFPEPLKVKVFCTDFWSSYATVAREFFPNAVVVADRFHVQRMGNNALEEVRKSYRKTLSKTDRLKLKDDRKLLLMKGDKLSEQAQCALDELLDRHPHLRSAWECKEGFSKIYDATDRHTANQLMDEWLQNVPTELEKPFREAISVLRTRRDHILNYFDFRFTNAYTESINAGIKTANRMGRGYSIEAIRAKMLFNPKALEKSARRIEIEEPDAIPDGAIGMLTYESMAPRRHPKVRTLYYGAHLPTLNAMLEAGEFE